MKNENSTKSEKMSARISCQYQILDIEDFSESHPLNLLNNSWTITEPFPSKEEVSVILNDKFMIQHNIVLQMQTLNKSAPVVYEAELWVRKGETYTFAVRFPSGSHMTILWQSDAETECLTPCSIPFYYDETMYHGCTSGM